MVKKFYLYALIFISFSSAVVAADQQRPKPQLHAKIDHKFLIDGNLVPAKHWKLAKQLPVGTSKLEGSLVITCKAEVSFALYPDDAAILGQGKDGHVKLAQLIHKGTKTSFSALKNINPGAWVAIKFQQEQFDQNELEALKRVKQRLGDQVSCVFKAEEENGEADEQETLYAVPMTLIQGSTLGSWLPQQDPNKTWSATQFLELSQKIGDAVEAQVHNELIGYHDGVNLENFIVEEGTNNIKVIDFGNAFVFYDENEAFAEECSHDFIMADVGVYEYIALNDYNASVQNEYWIEIYEGALEVFKHFKSLPLKEHSFIGRNTSAYSMLQMGAHLPPPFLKDRYGEEGLKLTMTNADELVIQAIADYRAKAANN